MAAALGIANVTVFPAYAGMSRSERLSAVRRLRFPRLRGDEPTRCAFFALMTRFSPPTRG